MNIKYRVGLVALVGILGLSACVGGDSAASTPGNVGTAGETTAGPATNSTAGTETQSTTPVKVSANVASASDIAAALAAAGVDNAERWADEIVEYRPYSADDADLTKLREELAKYNPGAGVIDLIVSVLQP
ncbi:MAG: hypothetical protein OEX04_10920 [Acidimicrobiia bacterium]|nr:hypothetical protein [Acidimicrobiia bacterium]MDH4307980.1 hypothetical protein [Acidimicrobiia bacterium]MDH5292403.1 hypothetical protein [Acidimicrobiia bacterium]